MCFCKTYCKQLLGHDIVKSDLLRGLSAFDSSVVLESPEKVYVAAIEKLSSHFVTTWLFSSSDKVKQISQYRSFIPKLRSEPVPRHDDWIHFIANHYEVQCRPELLQLFKRSCLCLASFVEIPPTFEVPMPSLESDKHLFESCIVSLQISYQTVPRVSSLYRDPKSIDRVFRLLGRGTELLLDKKFLIWNFSKGSNSRRTILHGKLESGYRKAVLRAEKPTVSSTSTTPSVSRTSSVNSSPSPDSSLNKLNVSLSRCSGSTQEGALKTISSKSPKSKKN